MTSILAVGLIATTEIPSKFVNVFAQEGAITSEGINTTMTGQNDTSTTSGNTAIPETIVTNATLAYAVGNDTSKPMNATLVYAQDDTGMMGGNDTGMTMNATLAISLIGNGTS